MYACVEAWRPDQDVIARVNSVLAEAGIPSDRFGGLRPESDAALPSSTQGVSIYRRQSVRVTLNDLSVQQIGQFLSRWISNQPLWVPTRIELTHSGDSKNPANYAVSMILSATYVSHEAPS